MALEQMGFWDHVDALRTVLLRGVGVVIVLMMVFFAVMPRLFDEVILAPCRPDFCLYTFLDSVGGVINPDRVEVRLINIQLASQFFIHLSASFWLALIAAFPILIYLIWSFVAPGLYDNEKRGAATAFAAGNAMFFLGVACGYVLVFPLTLRFLAEYQLSTLIPNQISLDSYMDNFMMLILIMGIIFELPVVAWLLGKAGLIDRSLFILYRRHAIVTLLILAAVVTPTGDPFTLTVVFLPIYLLWEVSAFTVPSPRKQVIET